MVVVMVAMQRTKAGKDGARDTPMQIGWPGEPSQEGTFLIKIKKKKRKRHMAKHRQMNYVCKCPMARMTLEAS